MTLLRSTLIALCLAALPQAGPAADQTVPFGEDDPAMAAAVADARRTLDRFLEHGTDKIGQSLPGAFVKVAFEVQHPEMTHEIIWIGPFKRDSDTQFVGLLSNEPEALPFKYREPVPFTYDMIRDWSYWADDGLGYGNFTTHVVLDALPAEQADPIRAQLATTPVPQGW